MERRVHEVAQQEIDRTLNRELKHYATKEYVTKWLLTLLAGQLATVVAIVAALIRVI